MKNLKFKIIKKYLKPYKKEFSYGAGNVFFANELAFDTTLLAVLTTDSALETTFPATLPATLLAVLTTDPAPETTLPATLLAVTAEFAAVSTIEVTAEFLLYQITNRRIALGLLILFKVSFPIYLPSKGEISTIL